MTPGKLMRIMDYLPQIKSANFAILVFLASGAPILSEAASVSKICGHNVHSDWEPVPNPVYDRKYRTIKTLCVNFGGNGKATSVSAFSVTGQVFTYSVKADQVLSTWQGHEYREVKMKPIVGGEIRNPWVRIVYFPENPSQVMTMSAITPDGYDISVTGRIQAE